MNCEEMTLDDTIEPLSIHWARMVTISYNEFATKIDITDYTIIAIITQSIKLERETVLDV